MEETAHAPLHWVIRDRDIMTCALRAPPLNTPPTGTLRKNSTQTVLQFILSLFQEESYTAFIAEVILKKLRLSPGVVKVRSILQKKLGGV